MTFSTRCGLVLGDTRKRNAEFQTLGLFIVLSLGGLFAFAC